MSRRPRQRMNSWSDLSRLMSRATMFALTMTGCGGSASNNGTATEASSSFDGSWAVVSGGESNECSTGNSSVSFVGAIVVISETSTGLVADFNGCITNWQVTDDTATLAGIQTCAGAGGAQTFTSATIQLQGTEISVTAEGSETSGSVSCTIQQSYVATRQ